MLLFLTLVLFSSICQILAQESTMTCNADTDLRGADIIFGAGLTDCKSIPLDTGKGFECSLTGYPHTTQFQLSLFLHNDTRQFAKMVKVVDEIRGPMGYARMTTCLTCNFTVYDKISKNDTSDCEVSTMFYDKKLRRMCLSQSFDNSNSTDNVQIYFFQPKIPYETFGSGSTLKISLKVDENLICSLPIRIRPQQSSWHQVTDSFYAFDKAFDEIQESPTQVTNDDLDASLATFIDYFRKVKDSADATQLQQLLKEADALIARANTSTSKSKGKVIGELTTVRDIISVALLRQRTYTKEMVKSLFSKSKDIVKYDEYSRIEDDWNDFVDAECRNYIFNKTNLEAYFKDTCNGYADALESLESFNYDLGNLLLEKENLITGNTPEKIKKVKLALVSLRVKMAVVEQMYSNAKEHYKPSDDPDRPQKHDILIQCLTYIQYFINSI